VSLQCLRYDADFMSEVNMVGAIQAAWCSRSGMNMLYLWHRRIRMKGNRGWGNTCGRIRCAEEIYQSDLQDWARINILPSGN